MGEGRGTEGGSEGRRERDERERDREEREREREREEGRGGEGRGGEIVDSGGERGREKGER